MTNEIVKQGDWDVLLPFITDLTVGLNNEGFKSNEDERILDIYFSYRVTIKIILPPNLKLDKEVIDSMFYENQLHIPSEGWNTFKGTIKNQSLKTFILNHFWKNVERTMDGEPSDISEIAKYYGVPNHLIEGRNSSVNSIQENGSRKLLD